MPPPARHTPPPPPHSIHQYHNTKTHAHTPLLFFKVVLHFDPLHAVLLSHPTQTAIGADKYALGFKGGWPYCSNGTEPDTCIFDGTARATIDHVRDVLGVKHASQWVNEPRSQAAWDAYGYFLHGP